jgi:hypothetical protein
MKRDHILTKKNAYRSILMPKDGTGTARYIRIYRSAYHYAMRKHLDRSKY